MKVFNLIFCLLFIFSAALQYNDPDPLRWMLLYAAACGVSLVRTGRIDPWLFGNHPLDPPPLPPGYMWSLGLLYLIFAVCVVILYFPCRWYARVRASAHSRWLSYL